MKTALKQVAIIFALILITVPSFGWNRRTHSAIAYIAEQHLTPKAKKTVNEILEGKSMVYYGSWLDDYRKQMIVEYTNDKGELKTGTISHGFLTDEEMNPVNAAFWTLMNVIGNSVKKIFYVRKYEVER